MSDFVFLINPDGYLGKSAAFEIGYAFANSIKVFALNKIKEMHQHFIYEIASPEQIIQKLKTLKEKPYIRN